MIFELQKFVNCQGAGSFHRSTYELAKLLENKIKKSGKPDLFILAAPTSPLANQ
jgi:hypothetical protein